MSAKLVLPFNNSLLHWLSAHHHALRLDDSSAYCRCISQQCSTTGPSCPDQQCAVPCCQRGHHCSAKTAIGDTVLFQLSRYTDINYLNVDDDDSSSSHCHFYDNHRDGYSDPTSVFNDHHNVKEPMPLNHFAADINLVQQQPPKLSSLAQLPQTAAKRQAGLPIPPALTSFRNAQISTACSCLRIPTPSTTITSTSTSNPTSTATSQVAATTTLIASTTTFTSTVTESPTVSVQNCSPPPTCGNSGVEWASYPINQNSGQNRDQTYSNFDPASFKTQSPFSPPGPGTSNVIGNIAQCTSEGQYSYPLYGITAPQCSFLAINHRRYMYIAVPGTYTFTLSNVDDAAFLWTGTNAVSGWTRSNATLGVTYVQNRGPGSSSFTQTFATSGSYVPIRVVFGNAQGGTGLEFSVTDPNGSKVVDSSAGGSQYLVTRSCDGVAAPAYVQPFGAET